MTNKRKKKPAMNICLNPMWQWAKISYWNWPMNEAASIKTCNICHMGGNLTLRLACVWQNLTLQRVINYQKQTFRDLLQCVCSKQTMLQKDHQIAVSIHLLEFGCSYCTIKDWHETCFQITISIDTKQLDNINWCLCYWQKKHHQITLYLNSLK